MVLSSSIIKDSISYNRINPSNIAIYENTSIFSFGLDVLRNSNEEMRKIMSEVYINSGYNINESFKKDFGKNFNFATLVKRIIDFFFEGLKYIYRKFKAILSKIIYDNNTINKYENKIREYNEEMKYDQDFFRYSYLDSPVPSINDFLNYFTDYNSLCNDITSEINRRNSCSHSMEQTVIIRYLQEDIIKKTEDLKNDLPDFYNKIRNNIFSNYGMDIGIINEDSFSDAIYRFFRSGVSIPSTGVTLRNSDYREALDRFLNSEKLLKNLEKDQRYIESKTNQEIKKIEKFKPGDLIKYYNPVDYEFEYALNNYLKVKTGQLQQICNIYTMVYSGKLQALKEAVIQDKKILFKVISAIIEKGE